MPTASFICPGCHEQTLLPRVPPTGTAFRCPCGRTGDRSDGLVAEARRPDAALFAAGRRRASSRRSGRAMSSGSRPGLILRGDRVPGSTLRRRVVLVRGTVAHRQVRAAAARTARRALRG